MPDNNLSWIMALANGSGTGAGGTDSSKMSKKAKKRAQQQAQQSQAMDILYGQLSKEMLKNATRKISKLSEPQKNELFAALFLNQIADTQNESARYSLKRVSLDTLNNIFTRINEAEEKEREQEQEEGEAGKSAKEQKKRKSYEPSW